MANTKSRGARAHRYSSSLIDRYGVGDTVLELNAQGFTYPQIVKTIWEKHSVKVSIMCVSRYLSTKAKAGSITPSNVYTNLETIREKVISETSILYEDYNRMFEDVKGIIDTSRMQSIDKLAVKRILEAKQKIILQEFTSTRATIGTIFEAVMRNEEGVNTLIIEFSKQLCPACRKKVVDTIVSYEKTRK